MKKDQINIPSVQMYDFCTITTADHMYKTLALCDSLRATRPDSRLHVLCIDEATTLAPRAGMRLYSLMDLSGHGMADTMMARYGKHCDKMRWCMKPVFMHYLLEQEAAKVIYTDNDIYFYSDPAFLFDLLDEHSFLLTPHHYPRDPHQGQNWLEANFKVGLYNAGFAGANRSATSSLQWWADCCAYRCEKNALRGLFDDQKYLDLIPVIEEKALIVRHKGCNVAEWNRQLVPRSERDGKVVLSGTYPLVFVHFNGTTVRAITEGNEPCLSSSLDTYLSNLKKYKADVKAEALMNHVGITDRIKYSLWKLATKWGI